jgi:hypothetical protein
MVEIDEIDLRFCLLHVFIIILPCGFSYVLKVYILEKKGDQVTKMIGLSVEYIVPQPKNYEQDVAKFVIFFVIITMSMKVGMKVGRSDDYH